MKFKLLVFTVLCACALCLLTGCSQPEPTVHEHEYYTIPAVEPTCTASGQTEGQKCRSCGRIFESPEPVAALGHQYSGEWTIDREPTELAEGEKSIRCERCGERASVTSIPRLAPSTQGLAFELNEIGDGYICVGIGTATGTSELRIPTTHEGLPVVEIAEQAFANNRRLTSLSIPSSVKTIRKAAFSGCSSLLSIDLPDTVEYIADSAFADTACYSNYSLWENGVLYIGNHLISVQPSAASGTFTVRYGTKTIGGAAFLGCSSMTFVSIPEGVVSIGNSAFYGCSSLASLILPDSLRIIGNGAISYCTSLTEFHLPANVQSILSSPFPGSTALTSIAVDENNPYFFSLDNCLIERSTGTLISGCATSVIPSDAGIKHIGNAAFYECKDLTAIDIPAGVETIGVASFYNCPSLLTVTLPSTLVTIDVQAFRACKALTDITLPASLRTINEAAFSYCTSLQRVSIAEGVTDIAESAFAYCTNLTTINLPNSLRTLNSGVLAHCDKIEYERYGDCLYLNNWLMDVANQQATSVTLKPTTVGIAPSAFSGCRALTSVSIPASVVYIGDAAFYDCWYLTNIQIPEGVQRIGPNTFAHCSRLQTLSLPSTVTSIGSDALLNCSALTSLRFGASEQMWNSIEKAAGWDRGASLMTVSFAR